MNGNEEFDGDVIEWIIGGNTRGFENGPAKTAKFYEPRGILVDDEHHCLYISDTDNNSIRKLNFKDGTVSTYAGGKGYGNLDGPRLEATFNRPMGISFDHAGNILVADHANHRIRCISPDGVVSTVSGGKGSGSKDGNNSEAFFNFPTWVIENSSGEYVVSDWHGNKIRKIDTKAKTVSTFAGKGGFGNDEGNGICASFNRPFGVVEHPNGNYYVTDQINQSLRVIDPKGNVSTFPAVDHNLNKVEFNGPRGIVVDKRGDLIVAEGDANTIRKINVKTGLTVSIPVQSVLLCPRAIVLDKNENIYIANTEAHNIIKISLISTLIQNWPHSHKDIPTPLQLKINEIALIIQHLPRDLYYLIIPTIIYLDLKLHYTSHVLQY
eukprot:TRINITY_DN19835_c0_g1_i1.p1 TRINITY_DN19835_c0_g1~~TRINITY_DN19835_c0_g1_i1.p1  ORF type:complete len:380 (+),score=94.97 TRINITY_DN19835_c0_g1_i1:23-1162(+)